MIMIIGGIIGLVLAIILITITFARADDFNEPGEFMLLTVFLVGLAVTCCYMIVDGIGLKPKAIDVYRGNTELVIHYEMRDSVLIPTDSVVVFKEK